tara:strand:+ start:260 stop:520 length:261 start_codon:yes stop_codon:yes gene_type:complete
MINRLLILLLSTSWCFALDAFSVEVQDDPKPSMRPVDRDWSYFKSVPCERINDIVFHSRSEEMLLAKRKSQCVNQYKAFLPTHIER